MIQPQEILKQIRNNLNNTFSYFTSDYQVEQFIIRYMNKFLLLKYTKSNCDAAYKEAMKILEHDINNKAKGIEQVINNEVQLSLNELEIRREFSSNTDSVKNGLIGAGLGVGASIILSGPLIPFAIIGIFVSSLSNLNENKKQLLSSIVSAARTANNEMINKIKKILDELILPEPKIVNIKVEKINDESTKTIELTPYQKEMKEFLELRGIKYLVHFSPCENLESIKKYGILSKKEATLKGIDIKVNDNGYSAHKADSKMKSTNDDYISLSITNYNIKLLQAYRYTGRIKKVYLFYINADILWKEPSSDRIYCNLNASHSNLKCGNNLESLKNIFSESITYWDCKNQTYITDDRRGKDSNEPTNGRAEILFEKNIDPKYIDFDMTRVL